MSYRKHHIKSKIHRIKPRKSIFKNGWFWFLILVLALVSFGIHFFIFYYGVQVRNIIISGNQKIASEDIKNVVSENIYKKFLSVGGPFGSWEISSKSIFLVNTDNLNKELLNSFSAIENVKINKHFFQTLDINVKERAPAAVFCPSQDSIGCYFIDASGITFEPADEVSKNMVIVRSRLSSEGEVADSRPTTMSGSEQTDGNSQIFKGKTVIEKNIMDLILKVEKNLKDNFQINLKEALVKSLIRLDISTSENWKIYFDTTSNIDLQLTKLNLLLTDEISASQRKNLRYINLIPDSKAIICDNPTCGT